MMSRKYMKGLNMIVINVSINEHKKLSECSQAIKKRGNQVLIESSNQRKSESATTQSIVA